MKLTIFLPTRLCRTIREIRMRCAWVPGAVGYHTRWYKERTFVFPSVSSAWSVSGVNQNVTLYIWIIHYYSRSVAALLRPFLSNLNNYTGRWIGWPHGPFFLSFSIHIFSYFRFTFSLSAVSTSLSARSSLSPIHPHGTLRTSRLCPRAPAGHRDPVLLSSGFR